MVALAKADGGKTVLAERLKRYEAEIVLSAFLLLRFFFKNILGYQAFFTQKPVFGLSAVPSVTLGTVVLVAVVLCTAALFGKLIRGAGEESEKPLIFLIALFFACPVSLPFLFDPNGISGTMLLYPFAVYLLAVLVFDKPGIQWLAPVICVLFFVPAVHTEEVFFEALRKAAILYVPLILMLLFLSTMKTRLKPGSKKSAAKKNEGRPPSPALFIVSTAVAAASYAYTLIRGKVFFEMRYSSDQKFDWYLLAALVIAAPALAGICAVLYKAAKSGLYAGVWKAAALAAVLMLVLAYRNYYMILVPFLVVSAFAALFYSVSQNSPAALKAVREFGDYVAEHRFAFYIVIIAMASLSNVTSAYLAKPFQDIFSKLPY